MSTLVIVEHDNKKMQLSTQHVLTAALKLDTHPHLLIVGYECESVVNEAANLQGVGKIWVADNPCYQYQYAENVSELIHSFAASYSHILVASNTFGKNLLPRVAALFDVAQISDVIKIVNPHTFERPIYAGNAIEVVESLDNKQLLSIRTTAFDATNEIAASPCVIEKIDLTFPADRTQFIAHQLSQSQRPDLSSAKMVVAGGRGLQSVEKFKLIEELADALGGAVGASRAAVDAGFVPNDCQVGQTGKVVAPTLYIAIGISGAVQHLAGMKDAKVIVAINKDEDAPIFQIATYGLVGDLFEIVPQLIQQIKSTRE
jgi:electron transfer flavoprotein alpha subunit